MPRAATERLHPMAAGIDTLGGAEVLARLFAAQEAALAVVRPALAAIEAGADLMLRALRQDGRLIYAGAGSSALMAIADALELPGTFGIAPGRIRILMAGGLPRDARMPGATEDDSAEATRGAADIGPKDTVIAVTASGRTPYALAVAVAARTRGAGVIAVANNRDAEIFGLADVAVCLPTPPELVAGSTRMGAGTAQKVALNLMSTLMAIRAGAVHDGMMVSLVADNDKLRARAGGTVAAIADVDAAVAEAALIAASGAVKPAVLIARGLDPAAAAALLAETAENLRAALARIDTFVPTTGPRGRQDEFNQGD